MFDFQAKIIFPTDAVAGPGPLPKGAERIQFDMRSGETLHGVHIPPVRKGRGPKTVVLVFAGNAWNSEDAVDYIHQVYPDAHVVGFHYRGYRPSTGSPSAKALFADAPLVHDFAVERVKPARTVAVGLSIGSGVAAHLATRRKLDGIILVTPFDSLKKVASDLYPILPIGAFFSHEMDSAAALKRSRTPVAIIAAQHDQIIPARRTEALRQATGNLVYDHTVRSAGHNDLYHRSEFQQAMRDALDALSG